MGKILYGGYEGTDSEISENVKSFGELLFQKLQSSGEQIVLVI